MIVYHQNNVSAFKGNHVYYTIRPFQYASWSVADGGSAPNYQDGDWSENLTLTPSLVGQYVGETDFTENLALTDSLVGQYIGETDFTENLVLSESLVGADGAVAGGYAGNIVQLRHRGRR